AVAGPFVCRCLPSRTVLRLHFPLIEPDVRICRIRLSDGFRHPSHERRHAPFLGLASGFPGRRTEKRGCSTRNVNPKALSRFRHPPEVRPLPSPGVTRLRWYYGPVRLPPWPGLSLTGVRLGEVPTREDLPCCVRSPYAGMPSPLPRRDRRKGSSCS